MNRITQLVVIAAVALSCSTSFGQFTFIRPSQLTPTQGLGSGPIGGPGNNFNFDISSNLGLPAGSVNLAVENGYVNAFNDSWTVSDDEETIFTVSGPVGVYGQLSHGSNLGSEAAANGTQSRDGIRTPSTESWSLLTNLDADYTAGSLQSGNVGGSGAGTLYVDYTGAETNALESNSSGFLWQSDQTFSTYTVFSNNTTELNNNYSIGFATVPEPASGLLLTFATGLFVLRRKRS